MFDFVLGVLRASRDRAASEANEEPMYKTRICLLAVTLCLALSGAASAKDHKDAKGKAGGKAAEHQSRRYNENSNAQSSEGATRGQERADERRNEHAQGRGDKASKHEHKQGRERGDGSRHGDSDADSDSEKRTKDKPERGDRGDRRGDRPEDHDSTRGGNSEDRGVSAAGVPKAHSKIGDAGGPADSAQPPATGARQRGFFGRMADFFSGGEE
jgi:hypothetical protein